MSNSVAGGDERAREEILVLLASMGVKLPSSTKLPLVALEERLTKALDCAQRHPELSGSNGKFKPKKLPSWRKSRSLGQAMQSASLEEAVVGGITGGAYSELRFLLSNTIGTLYEEKGESIFIFEDPERDRLINLAINGVFLVTEDIPLISVEYTFGSLADDDEEYPKGINSSGGHTLLRKLLELNATRIKDQGTESSSSGPSSGPIPSYFLPLGPLSLKDIGSLCKDVGCIVCGGPSKSNCAGCRSVHYCGKECQRTDWQRHKLACRSLDFGTWVSLTYAPGFSSSLSRTARSPDDFSKTYVASSDTNVHGANAFIVKIQLSSPGGLTMLVYDRQRSFQGQFFRTQDPVGFQRLEDVVATGHLGLKIYLWAKRVGDRTLSICLNHKPDQSTIVW